MIEKMKKLSLLIYHNSKDKFLQNLQSFGVVHLECDKSAQNDDILGLKDEISKLNRLEKLLISLEKDEKLKIKDEEYKGNFDNLISEIDAKREKIEEYSANFENISKEISILSIWGNFEPENLNKLNSIGLNIKFYSTPKAKFDKIDKTKVAIEKISDTKGTVYFVIFYKKDDVIVEIDAQEERIPLKNLVSLQKEANELQNKINLQKDGLIKLIKYKITIKNKLIELDDKLSFSLANASLSSNVEDKVLIISGWIPQKGLNEVTGFLQKEDVAYLIEEPKAGDNVPIQLRNGPFAKLFEPIMKIFSLPSYYELDTTAVIAPFYAIFFGMCQADLGYGLFLLTILTIAFFAIKNKSVKSLILLGMVLAFMTSVFGFLLNGAFGFSITDELIKNGILPDVVKPFVIFADVNDPTDHDAKNDIMILAMALGFVQLLIGLIMKTINSIKNNGIQAGLQPIGNFLFIAGVAFAGIIYGGGEKFKIGPLYIGKFLYSYMDVFTVTIVLLIAGVTLIMLFNNIDKAIFIRPLTGLWEMYNTITGILGDILSYIRLFALGLSGGLLGAAINQIAFMTKGDSIIGLIPMLLIMIVGHGLNLSLSILGSFVHPLRLTFVEFYKNLGFTGGGIAYTPFNYKTNIKK